MVTPTQVGGVDEGGAQGVDLCHEDMGLAAPEGGLESPRGRREVSRRGGGYHVRVALDSSGNAYVVGANASTDFPTTPGACKTTLGGGETHVLMDKVNALRS